MEERDYPGVTDRVKAVTLDSFILVLNIVIISQIFSLFEDVPNFLRIIAFVFVFLLYDPIFTSTFGGTIGHMIIGIRVKRENDETRNIIFPFAVARFIFKLLLGWLSLLTVLSNKKSQAIHDFLAQSVVVYNYK